MFRRKNKKKKNSAVVDEPMGPPPPASSSSSASLPSQRRAQKKTSKSAIELYVYHLDNEEYKFELPKNATGEDLMHRFMRKIACTDEIDYFGFYFPYTDPIVWLTDGLIRKQTDIKKPIVLEFGVKFFPSHPRRVVSEHTRFLIFLQIKEDLAIGRFVCPAPEAIRLCALAVQIELGDFDSTQHPPGYLSDMLLLPEQTTDVETEIARWHRALERMTFSEALQAYLSLASRQHLYGVDLHPANLSPEDPCFVGISAQGIRLYNAHLGGIQEYKWSAIQELSFNNKRVRIVAKMIGSPGRYRTTDLHCASKKHARALWSSAVQRHTFFRRRKQPRITQGKSIKKLVGLKKEDPLTRAHLSRYGKTETETEEEARQKQRTRSGREDTNFTRPPPARRSVQRKRLGSNTWRTYSQAAKESIYRSRPQSARGLSSWSQSRPMTSDAIEGRRPRLSEEDTHKLAGTVPRREEQHGFITDMEAVTPSEPVSGDLQTPATATVFKLDVQEEESQTDAVQQKDEDIKAGHATTSSHPRLEALAGTFNYDPDAATDEQQQQVAEDGAAATTTAATTGAAAGVSGESPPIDRRPLRTQGSIKDRSSRLATKLGMTPPHSPRHTIHEEQTPTTPVVEVTETEEGRADAVKTADAAIAIPAAAAAAAAADTARGDDTYLKARTSWSHIGGAENSFIDIRAGCVYRLVDAIDETWLLVDEVGTAKRGKAPRIIYTDDHRPAVPPAHTREHLAADTNSKDAISRASMRGMKRSGKVVLEQMEPESGMLTLFHTVSAQQLPTEGVLVCIFGPGSETITDALLEAHEEEFTSCVPSTTRQPRPNEKDGVDYNFVSAETMREDITAGQYVEVVRFHDVLYGTHMNSVRHALKTNKERFCLIDVNDPQSLRRLHVQGMVPISLFLEPANEDVLRQQNPGISQKDTAVHMLVARKLHDECMLDFTHVLRNTGTVDEMAAAAYRLISSAAGTSVWAPDPALPPPTVNVDLSSELVGSKDDAAVPQLQPEDVDEKKVWGYETITFPKVDGKLGFSFTSGPELAQHGREPGVYVTRIVSGGSADRDGRLQCSDRIIEIDGDSCEGLTHKEVTQKFVNTGREVTLKVARRCYRVVLPSHNGLYGLGIKGGADSNHPVTVSRIQSNSAAAACDDIKIGHEIVYINGINVQHAFHSQVLAIIKASPGQLDLIIHPRRRRVKRSPAQSERTPPAVPTRTTTTTAAASASTSIASASQSQQQQQRGEEQRREDKEAAAAASGAQQTPSPKKEDTQQQASVNSVESAQHSVATSSSRAASVAQQTEEKEETEEAAQLQVAVKEKEELVQKPEQQLQLLDGKQVEEEEEEDEPVQIQMEEIHARVVFPRDLHSESIVDEEDEGPKVEEVRGNGEASTLPPHAAVRDAEAEVAATGKTQQRQQQQQRQLKAPRDMPKLMEGGENGVARETDERIRSKNSAPGRAHVSMRKMSSEEEQFVTKLQQPGPVDTQDRSFRRRQSRVIERGRYFEQADETLQRKLIGGDFENIERVRPGAPIEEQCTVALRRENKYRNRYRDIIPYDDTRVKLKDNDNDYVNANHVSFSIRDKLFRYIVSQGPKQETLPHFWQMVWDNSVRIICMLTTLRERGQAKCNQYWPSTPKTKTRFGPFKVCLNKEVMRPGYVIRDISLEKDGKPRRLFQFQFVDWPDHGVPSEPDTILAYIKEVESFKARLKQPMPLLVHCSAGIGRSGVFMVLELGLASFQDNLPVNLNYMLTELRAQRMGMVQTKDQYKFCYTTLAGVRRDEGPHFKITP